MEFKKEDENYIYNVIGKNVKKYRKEKKWTQAELAEQIDYSLSFIASIESKKKYQTFSLGALWRIASVLGIDMYKLCIDEEIKEEKPKYIKYKCNQCTYETDIPYELVELLVKANQIYTQNELGTPLFDCDKCDGHVLPTIPITKKF